MLEQTLRRCGPYQGAGLTRFDFDFKIFSESDVLVIKANAQLEETILQNVNDYTVTWNRDQVSAVGGYITLRVMLSANESITILSQVPYSQNLDLHSAGNFDPTTINRELDRHVAQIQQLNEKISRAAVVPVSEDMSGEDWGHTLVESSIEAGRYAAAAAASASQAASSAAVASGIMDLTDEIQTVAGARDHIETVVENLGEITETAGNMHYIQVVGSDFTGQIEHPEMHDFGWLGQNDIPTAEPTGGSIQTTAENILDVQTVGQNIEAIRDAAEAAAGFPAQITALAQLASAAEESAEAAAAAAESAGFSARYTSATVTANSTVAIADIVPPTNVKAGDRIMNSAGDVFAVASVTETAATVGDVLTSLKGPKGDTGPAGPIATLELGWLPEG